VVSPGETAAKPLSGLRVLDLSRVLAGPYCCALLGEAGAEVIKVERPGKGDENRRWGHLWHGESLDFMNVNRNKRGITVNLSHDLGQEVIKRLAGRADILVENFVPGTLDRFGLSYESLAANNPRLIYCSISAYGLKGPMRTKPGYDGAVQAFSGHMAITGEADGGPVRSGASMIDMATGFTAYSAVLTAVISRARSGKGQRISASLLQTALSLMGAHAAVYLMTGHQPKRAGSGVSHLAPYGAYQTQDSHVVVGTLNEEAWAKLCAVLGLQELTEDERFNDPQKRVANRKILDSVLSEVFATQSSDHWVGKFERAGLVISHVQTLSEVMRHPQVLENHMLNELSHSYGKLTLVGAPFSMEADEIAPQLPPPLLGQHTDEILYEFGYTEQEIKKLRSEGAI